MHEMAFECVDVRRIAQVSSSCGLANERLLNSLISIFMLLLTGVAMLSSHQLAAYAT